MVIEIRFLLHHKSHEPRNLCDVDRYFKVFKNPESCKKPIILPHGTLLLPSLSNTFSTETDREYLAYWPTP